MDEVTSQGLSEPKDFYRHSSRKCKSQLAALFQVRTQIHCFWRVQGHIAAPLYKPEHLLPDAGLSPYQDKQMSICLGHLRSPGCFEWVERCSTICCVLSTWEKEQILFIQAQEGAVCTGGLRAQHQELGVLSLGQAQPPNSCGTSFWASLYKG